MTDSTKTSSENNFNTTANKLTAVRIAFVPLVVAFLFKDSPRSGFIAAILFGIASITDYFDGYYARIEKNVTILGKLLDPLADKFLVVSSLVMLMHLQRIAPAIVILLICRELAITGLRAIASAEGIVIGASSLAKWKTTTQMIAIPMLMLHETYFGVSFQLLGTVFTYLSLALSMWSAKDYIVDFFKTFRQRSLEKRQLRKAQRLAKKAAKLKRIVENDPSLVQMLKDITNENKS